MLGGYMHMWACTFFPLRACVCVCMYLLFPACMCVCMYLLFPACMCVCMYLLFPAYMCVSSFPCVCVLVCVCVCIFFPLRACVCMCVCVCVRVHVSSFPCMHVCVWCKQTETVSLTGASPSVASASTTLVPMLTFSRMVTVLGFSVRTGSLLRSWKLPRGDVSTTGSLQWNRSYTFAISCIKCDEKNEMTGTLQI